MIFRIEVAGVDSLLIRFFEPVNELLLEKISCCTIEIQAQLNELLLDVVPSYSTILVTYSLLKADDSYMRQQLQRICIAAINNPSDSLSSKEICLPVCYERSLAPDIIILSEHLGLSVQEIAELHCAQIYRVFAVGFTPGFAYLGELPPLLRVPRLSTPRVKVPSGSVAIAEKNTAVYPQSTPGGWWLIGRCPILLFDKQRTPPVNFQTGDRVRFEPISASRYEALRQF